jgi:hypothetical protein
MADIDPFMAITGAGAAALVLLAGWATVQYERDMTTGWRATRYASSVLALVLGFGFGQSLAMQVAAARGMPLDSMLVVLAGALIGSFLVMWGVQVVEYAVRRLHGLEPLPYRIARFDLFRW